VGVVNRRNAVAGWAAWKLAKRMLRRKAKKAAPRRAAVARAARRPKALVAFIVATGTGLAAFLRRRRSGES
jgi:hypothetical protein